MATIIRNEAPVISVERTFDLKLNVEEAQELLSGLSSVFYEKKQYSITSPFSNDVEPSKSPLHILLEEQLKSDPVPGKKDTVEVGETLPVKWKWFR